MAVERKLVRLTEEDLTLGEPLKFSVYDRHGTLLLRKGVVLGIPAQLERLLQEGSYLDFNEQAEPEQKAVAARPPTFLRAEEFCTKLKNLFVKILRLPDQIDIAQKTAELAADIEQACEDDYISLVAALHVDTAAPYLAIHQVFGAVLTGIVAKRAELPLKERISLICAALTRDIGQAQIQHEIDKVQGPLPDALKAQVQNHPRKSMEILCAGRVMDPIWLKAIEQHHERMDGTGYQAKLSADKIGRGGRLLCVCDTYSAMVKPRPYRTQGKANFTQLALREIFTHSGSTMDKELSTHLIKAIGIVPPGSIVKLKCGEIAIVKDFAANINDANVYSLYNKDQMPIIEPPIRKTSTPGFEVVGMAHYSECRSAQMIIRSLWLRN